MTTQPVHTLYRFFDGGGTLLYVGRTVDARSRFRSHERSKEWFDRVARIDREVFSSAESLAAAEVVVIKTEHPAHNVQHSARPKTDAAPNEAGQDQHEDRVLRRIAVVSELCGDEIDMTSCGDSTLDSGCNCPACVVMVIAQIDRDRENHADDEILVKGIDALESEYLAGAEVIDWLYDLGDLVIFRRMRLQTLSLESPAPVMASLHDGLIQVGCPFCLGLHDHYVLSGVPVGPLDAACQPPGRARYVPVFDAFDAINESIEWHKAAA